MKKRHTLTNTASPFTKEPHAVINGRHLEPGTEFTVRGLGRLVFHALVTNKAGEQWVDAWPVNGQGGWRCVHPDRIKTVHRQRKRSKELKP